MKWFKPKYSVCKECGVHFNPVLGIEARWGDLCATHRKPVMERDLRKDAVLSWASMNWEKIEPMSLKEANEAKEQYQAFQQEALNAIAAQQQASSGGLYNLKGHFGLSAPPK